MYLKIYFLSAGSILASGIGIGLIVLLFSTLLSSGIDKAKNIISPQRSIYEIEDIDELEFQFKLIVQDKNFDEIILLLKRILELDQTNFLGRFHIGGMYFMKGDFENAFNYLKIDYEVGKEEMAPLLSSPDYKMVAHNAYMLGYTYHLKNDSINSNYFKELASTNESYMKEYKHFFKKYAY